MQVEPMLHTPNLSLGVWVLCCILQVCLLALGSYALYSKSVFMFVRP